jgi:diguanylate cyclase (GGDEF)-like protein/PAS domain S-box-containing protein
MIKNRFHKFVRAVTKNLIVEINRFFNNFLIDEQSFLLNKGEVNYWKNRIFYITSFVMLIFGAPLMLFGGYMFYHSGDVGYGITEILFYTIGAIIITRKSISVKFKKLFIVFSLYTISIFLLLTTGLLGGGMVCVVFTLILTGCLLEKKQIEKVVMLNLLVFCILTVLVYNGYFDGTPMAPYKRVWVINGVTAQVFGIMLLILMNTIYNGLEKQTHQIRKSEASLAASEIKHREMIANISDAIVIIDQAGVVTYHSPNLVQRFPWMSKEIKNRSFYDEIHPEDRTYMEGVIQSLLQENGRIKTMEARYLGKDGKVGYLELTAVNLTEDANINGFLINYSDITERKVHEEEIVYLNQHDSLTGLYNRDFFEKEKRRLDVEAQLPLSVIVGDINGLKIINDSLGHTEGDKLLVTIGNIIEKCCREEDIVARISGDEFNILLPRTKSEETFIIMKKINSACEDYNKSISSELYHISISLGSATRTRMEESYDNILKIAEDYMYKRKLLEGRSFHSSILSAMKTALFEKSHETEQHAKRLIQLSKAVGEAIGLTAQQFDELELFSTLHDIGKIGIDNQILNKPAKLDDDEWIKMKKHSEIGYRIAMASPELMSIAYYILTHHERWDGKGYPQGLAGENIPLLSRILAVADSYDAMTEDRPYRKGMQKQEAIDEIVNNTGTQFDPEIARIFVEIVMKDLDNIG